MVFTYLIYSIKVSEDTDHVLASQSCARAEISGEAKNPPPSFRPTRFWSKKSSVIQV